MQIKQQMQTLDNVTDLGVVHGEPNYKDRLNLMNRWNPLIIVPYFIDFGWIVKENCDFIIEERSKGDGGATCMTDPLFFNECMIPAINR